MNKQQKKYVVKALFVVSLSFMSSMVYASNASALQAAIQAAGYRCDVVDVDSIVPFSWSGKSGYHIYCNGYQYGYEVEDVGGRIVVTVK